MFFKEARLTRQAKRIVAQRDRLEAQDGQRPPLPGSSREFPARPKDLRVMRRVYELEQQRTTGSEVAVAHPTRRITPDTIKVKKAIHKTTTGIVTRSVLRSKLATEFVLRTREARLAAEAQTSPRAMRRGNNIYLNWAQNAVEVIPSPFLYGIGDAVTALEAISGVDLLGRKMAPHQRWLMGVATAVPVVPGRLLIDSTKKVQDRVAERVAQRRGQR